MLSTFAAGSGFRAFFDGRGEIARPVAGFEIADIVDRGSE